MRLVTHHVEFVISFGSADVSSDVCRIHSNGCCVTTNGSNENSKSGIIKREFLILNKPFYDCDSHFNYSIIWCSRLVTLFTQDS